MIPEDQGGNYRTPNAPYEGPLILHGDTLDIPLASVTTLESPATLFLFVLPSLVKEIV